MISRCAWAARAALLFAALLASGIFAPHADAGPDKVEVCHLDDDGEYVIISVAEPALPALLARGDVLPNPDRSCGEIAGVVVSFVVQDAVSLAPLDATVTITLGDGSTIITQTVGGVGAAVLPEAGFVTIIVSADGYSSQSLLIAAVDGAEALFFLTPL